MNQKPYDLKKQKQEDSAFCRQQAAKAIAEVGKSLQDYDVSFDANRGNMPVTRSSGTGNIFSSGG